MQKITNEVRIQAALLICAAGSLLIGTFAFVVNRLAPLPFDQTRTMIYLLAGTLAALWLWQRTRARGLQLRPDGIAFGLLGVLCSFALAFLADIAGRSFAEYELSAASPALVSVLPRVLLFLGFFTSYLLTLGRSLLVAQMQQFSSLMLAEQQFRSLFYQSPDAVFAFDCRGYYQAVNPVARKMIGISDAELGSTHYLDVIGHGVMHESDVAMFDTAFQNTLEGEPQIFEVGFVNASGERRRYESAFMPIVLADRVEGVYSVVKDVTERTVAQENERILKNGLESSDNAVMLVDVRAGGMSIVFVNPAFTEMTGYGAEEMLGASPARLNGPDTDQEQIDTIIKAVAAGTADSVTMKTYRRDGTWFWNLVSMAPVRDVFGHVTHFTAIMKDVSAQKEQEKKLAHQATHDQLTGLGNRMLLEQRLEENFAEARLAARKLAVLFIDLDDFKPINDALGHKVGDALLCSVARRLEDLVANKDTLVRFGGDEFVLLQPGLRSRQQAEDMATNILDALAMPHEVAGHELHISASIGISMSDSEMAQPEKLVQHADMAMYKAKQRGRDTYEIYSEDLDVNLSQRVTLRNELQDALNNGQLYLNYQPQVDANGLICGIEALVRWMHPEKGFISPADFIPVAEETGQIVQLGKWVTTQACIDARKLLDMGLLTGRMAVNLSPLQFHRIDFLHTLRSTLVRTGLPPECLELELTEGILMKDSATAIATLHEINDLGVATAIDDFGTGFSSFGYLKSLPVDNIKIDRSFVDNVTTSKKDAAVCKGVIALAREMELQVVAEGIETVDQFNYLKANGCEVFQGYYFARPMAIDQLISWIRENRSAA